MLKTHLGPFNGTTWEHLCQLVFKAKYADDGYQQIAADPGDFGLEGFTIKTGYGFQCYCPDKHYDTKDLYDAQRDKITEDIGKLKKYEKELAQRLGTTRISDWIFVSPIIDRNALLIHAKHKEVEVKSWKLPIIADDFCIHLRDGDFYVAEIDQIRQIDGVAYSFDTEAPSLAPLTAAHEAYEANLLRKTEVRLAQKTTVVNRDKLVTGLYNDSLRSFLETDSFLKRISDRAPTVYMHILRIINEHEHSVREKAATWVATPEELVDWVRDGLRDRILADLAPKVDSVTASQIARHLVARWMAICQLDFDAPP